MRVLLLLLPLFFLIQACDNQQKPQVENAVPDEVPKAIINVKFSGPLEIKKGGKYTGNYKSDKSDVAAITISTNDPVEITGCIIASAGEGIKCYGGTKANIHHNSIYGLTPSGDKQWGRALDDYQPQYLKFDNNYVEHTGGLYVDHSNMTKEISIRSNVVVETDKRKTDLTPGDAHIAAIQLNTVPGMSGEIAWNQITNTADSSYVEDCILLYNSGGTKETPYAVHDNYIKGAYPFPTTSENFTGSGITVDGDPGTKTFETVSQYVNAFNNQVISTCNAGMNIAAGHDIHYYNNTIISSGMYPDGTKSDRFWAGCSIWDASHVGAGVFKNNSIKDNTIGYVRPHIDVPFKDRQDYVVVGGSPISVGSTDNKHLPNPITLETETKEWGVWQKKLAAKKMTVGNTANGM